MELKSWIQQRNLSHRDHSTIQSVVQPAGGLIDALPRCTVISSAKADPFPVVRDREWKMEVQPTVRERDANTLDNGIFVTSSPLRHVFAHLPMAFPMEAVIRTHRYLSRASWERQ